ncbi:M20 family peptidase [Ruegeria sp. PrR005]|uniref:M20/M25/M40 family metallo-hydrolase n=1 Tax=Ruegeria sp. PrR005 TaxID=2706882 RepID=A0A6B2NWW2_9RHOB|nr:M20 family peptidase [Ruegeria sp. PrR005]NDW47137.1 M20/M25/M40 family metallo-hydrolase [Ruegeria sp. PrR005]
MIKRILAGLALLLVILVAVIAVKTVQYRPAQVAASEPFSVGADVGQAAQDLAEAVRFRTVSTDMSHPDFPGFLAFLQERFPAVHRVMERTLLEPVTPLYKWQGTNPDLPPVMLAAHYDVVPVTEDTLGEWDHPPFAGVVADGFVWGRGTLDNKGALIAALTAAEKLINDGFTPERTIYFSFGGDEETGGLGAIAVADHLRGQGVQLAWVLDEGSFVLDKIIPGLDVPVASINLAEKGYLTIQLVAHAEGGHSSMPPRQTAVGQLARAVARLQEAPMPGGLSGVSAEFFDALGRHFTLDKRAIFANRWLFGPVLEGILSGSPSTDAMLRTTTAPTMLEGSPKENVLPTRAVATINFRLHPRDSIDDVLAHVKAAIDDEGIEIVADRDLASPASPVSDSQGPGFKDVEASIREVFGPIASVPGLTIAATDARHYAKAADAAYRINPFQIEGDDLARFHGIDERLSIANIERGINFYAALIGRQ